MKYALTHSLSIPLMLGINIIAALFTVIAFMPLSDGERVRPMAWAALMVLIAIVTFCLGLLLSVIDMARGKSKLAIFGFLLSLAPFPISLILFEIFIMIKGLHVLS